MHLAAESDGELRRVFASRRPGARHSPRHGEEFLAVRQFGSLQQQPVGRAEGLVDIPARAGAAILGELHATGGKPLGDVAGVVHPQEEKRNAPRIRRVQAGQTVANLFKAGAKPPPEKVEVISKVTRSLEEAAVGHHHRCCEIAGKRGAEQGSSAVILQPVGFCKIGYEPRLPDQRQLDQKMENPLWAAKRFAEKDFAAVIVIAAQLRAHDVYRQDANTKPGVAGRVLDQRFQQATTVGRPAHDQLPELLGRRLGFGEIVVGLLQHVAHPFHRIVDTAGTTTVSGIHFQLVTYLAISLKQAEHPARRRGRGRHQVLKLAPRHPLSRKQRVGEHFGKVGHQRRTVILGKALHVDVEAVAELEQKRHRQRPLVMLEKVQV